MTKRFWISVVVVFALSMIIGFVVHHTILIDEYRSVSQLYRPMGGSDSFFHYLVIGQFIFSMGFVWIYRQGREDKPFLAQGIRYGLAVAVLMTIPMYLISYAIQPLPSSLVVKQILLDTVGVLIMGVAVAWLNK